MGWNFSFHGIYEFLDKVFVCPANYIALAPGWSTKAIWTTKGTEMCFAQNRSPVAGNRYVTKEELEALWALKRTFVPLGTAIGKINKDFLGEISAQHKIERKGYDLSLIIGTRILVESPPTHRAFVDFMRHHNRTRQSQGR